MISIILLTSSICSELSNPTIPLVKKAVSLYKKYKEVINYLIVGGLTTLVSVGSYAIFRIFSGYMASTVLSWITAVIFAYITNRKYVFESKNSNILVECIKFVSCRLATLGSELLAMYILVDLIKLNDMISKVLVQFIIVILNYVLSKLIVFTTKRNK